jgi:hypothetical protein
MKAKRKLKILNIIINEKKWIKHLVINLTKTFQTSGQ